MTFLDFWKAFGGAILAVTTSLAAFIVGTKITSAKLEGRVGELETKAKEHASCLETLRASESDDKLRQYRADEADRKMSALSEQLSKGFGELQGAINAINVQNVRVIEQLGSQQKSLDKAWVKLEEHEKILRTLEGAEEP